MQLENKSLILTSAPLSAIQTAPVPHLPSLHSSLHWPTNLASHLQMNWCISFHYSAHSFAEVKLSHLLSSTMGFVHPLTNVVVL